MEVCGGDLTRHSEVTYLIYDDACGDCDDDKDDHDDKKSKKCHILANFPVLAKLTHMMIYIAMTMMIVRGGIKKLFFSFRSKGGGVSANPKNPYQKILD